jgi:S-adenosylmethionine:tRNA ribosyltransferase-isomerase
LRPGDLLVLNNTRVIPARLLGHKVGAVAVPVEVLLLLEKTPHQWLGLVKPGRRIRPGHILEFRRRDHPEKTLRATVLASDLTTRGRILEFDLPPDQPLLDHLEDLGEIPLPPYIRERSSRPEQYQTVYSQIPGAVAAPTAGLHFTPSLLKSLEAEGISHCFITLHVGLGTFRPIEVADVSQHHLHQEWLAVSPATVAQIHHTQAQGGRIIAVGTTVVRSLETAAQSGILKPFQGHSSLYIYPGYQWRVVQGLITNFHLPRSSLLLLVSAFIGRERLLDLYHQAIAAEYRFYSFGDAMLLWPD